LNLSLIAIYFQSIKTSSFLLIQDVKEQTLAKQKKSKQKIDPSIWVILIGGLMLVVAVIVLIIQAQQPAQSAVTNQNLNIPYPEVERVSLQDAKAAYDAGTAIFVDVRGDDLYNVGHIPGALSIPESDLESRITNLDPNARIITYCT
jgi:NADH:ubiquinone oxidoreductase subunit 5 (subunit L)/multisubunit Na+/H+ antiporter MnhA subunit